MDIWEELYELNKLDEARFNGQNRREHYLKHIEKREGRGDLLFPDNMTEEEYDDAAHLLSSSEGKPLGTGRNQIMGYVSQSGYKVKIKRLQGSENEFVAYVGDDITGEVITYYIKNYAELMAQANPFERGRLDRKYKSDLDGKFIGLNAFIPRRNLSEDEIDDIKYKITHNIPLGDN